MMIYSNPVLRYALIIIIIFLWRGKLRYRGLDQLPEITKLVWSRAELCPLGCKVIGQIQTEEGPKLTQRGVKRQEGLLLGTGRDTSNAGRSWGTVRKSRLQRQDNLQLQKD